ncbi:MAG: hypothetical protein HFE65_05660 [Clostridiales bacterium]|nr:hypothetical protein [Clostridiales bacterium]
MFVICTVPAFALTESEVQDQVNSAGRESVTGNILVWFLCAIAFLKVSQKIDSFMSALGINVGHTGGSAGGSSSGGSSGGFASGGLAGVVSRSFTKGAEKSATDSGSGGLSGAVFNSSLNKGGGFANKVIGNVATGNVSSMGTMSGEKASSALMSYMGYTALGEGASDIPSFSDVEIGGGRITATEVTEEHPEGIATAMYHAGKYAAPDCDFTTVQSADGEKWYKQYAVDTVQKKPYQAPDGSVAYNESIIKKLPKAPPRKDRL